LPAAGQHLRMKPLELSPSPFLPHSARVPVWVAHGDDPYETTLSALSELDLGPAHGARVLLKPNAGRVAASGSGIITEARVVAAAIDALQAAGATVAVGDSPIVGVKRLEALKATGIAEVAQQRDCAVLDLDARRSKKVPLPEGQAITELKVCAEVLEYDLVVSIPVMKIHMHTGVSLAVKNMKGCLWRRSKVDLHMLPPVPGSDEKSLDIAIADMSKALRPHLSIVDGTVGMEGLGPSAGKPKPFGAIVVSADAYAADAVACRLMSREATDIAHLRLGAERGYGTIEPAQIQVFPEGWQELAIDFEPAPDNLAIEFPDVNVLDENSCSACQSTLLLFLQRYGNELFDYFPEGQPVTVAIGKGLAEVPAGTLCIGNCMDQHRARGTFVKGCPPVGSAILRALKRGST
jgi:uncharacterized protein (DUF362 family)